MIVGKVEVEKGGGEDDTTTVVTTHPLRDLGHDRDLVREKDMLDCTTTGNAERTETASRNQKAQRRIHFWVRSEEA